MKYPFSLLAFAVFLLCSLSAQSEQSPVPQALSTTPADAQRPNNKSQHLTPAQQKLKTFRTMFSYSDTVYLDTEVLRNALLKRFEVHAWKIGLADKESADVWIKVTRPVFTFDWRYRITDRATGQELGAGRIVAWDGKRAADAVAADIARMIGRVRALPTHLLAALGDEPNARKWDLTYEQGSEGPRHGARLTVSVSPERIVGRRQSRVLFVIPAQSVSGVGYNMRNTDPTKHWEAFWGDVPSSANDPNSAMGALMLIPVVIAGEVLLKQFKSTEHFCDVTWMDSGVVRSVVLKGDAKTAEEFLAAVGDASHRKATDMEAEADALRQAIEREDSEGHFVPLQLEKRTAVGWKALEPGSYRVVTVERDSQRGIAYFLPDAGTAPLEIKTIAAQMPVTIEPRASEPDEPLVRYREANGISSIDEIVTADKTLRFRAIPLQFADEPQVSEDMEQLLAEAALKPKYNSVHVKSGTVYLKREVMERALAEHPAFIEWEVKVAQHPEEADLALVVTRPFLTFDWNYVVTEVKTGKKLIEGKITARDGGKAASVISDQLVNALKADAAQEIRDEME